MSTALAVIDPAFGRAVGHHAGFAAVLAASRPPGRSVRLFGHRSTPPDQAEPLRQAGLEVVPAFATDHYVHFGKPGNTARLWPYIGVLARELARIHAELAETGERHCLLYHSLSWEHTSALALALAQQPASLLEHRVLLMFNPGIAYGGKTINPLLRLNYRLALAALERIPTIRLYAGCSEYAVSYAQLLERPEPLPVHPCIVGDWAQTPPAREPMPSTDAMRVLLYVGVAKNEKGFTALPDTLSLLQRQCGKHARFVVQYTKDPCWATNHDLQRTEQDLQALARDDARLELHCGFWSDAQLAQQLARSDLLVLNYQPQVYADKTSGLLWLAAWHRLPTLVPPGWLQREARRIGLVHGPCSALHDIGQLEQQLTYTEPEDSYLRSLFTGLWDWLDAP